MATPSELDLKLLERALDQQATAGRAFFRDLKLAVLALLVFQFGIFFRYVDLADRSARLELRQTQLRAEQRAVEAVRDQFSAFEAALQQGSRQMSEELRQSRDRLRSRLGSVNQAIARIQQGPGDSGFLPNLPAVPGRPLAPPDLASPPTGAAPPAPAASNMPRFRLPGVNPIQRPPSGADMVIQAPIRHPNIGGPALPADPDAGLVDIFDDLSPDDRRVLSEGRPVDKVERIVAERVESKLIEPLFAALNANAQRWIQKPIADESARLRGALETNEPVLKRWGFPIQPTEAKVASIEATLAALKFAPPESNRTWWRTYQEKGAVFEGLRLQTEAVVTEVGSRLSAPELDLTDLEKSLEKLNTEAGIVQSALQKDVTRLESEYTEVQSLVASVAKPLATIALNTREMVCYDPVILGVVFVFFLVRYVRLARRARDLATACRAHGYSDEMVRVYFADDPSMTFARWQESLAGKVPMRNLASVALCALPGVLAIVSAARVLASPSLRGDAPRALYVVTILGFLGAVGLLLAAPVLPERWRWDLGIERGNV